MGLVQELQGFLYCALAKVEVLEVLEARIFVGYVLVLQYTCTVHWSGVDYSLLGVVFEGMLFSLMRKPE